MSQSFKICNKCKEVKPIGSFYTYNGYTKPRCKKCHNAQLKSIEERRTPEEKAKKREYLKLRARAWHRRIREENNVKELIKLKLLVSRREAKKYNYTPCITSVNYLVKHFSVNCELCYRDEGSRIHLDHDHTTGEFRGWLCGNCNRAIGLFQNNPVLLEKAIIYLNKEGK